MAIAVGLSVLAPTGAGAAAAVPPAAAAEPSPPATARALVAEPRPFLSFVQFANASAAVAEWSNCALPATEGWCRVAFTATGDGWRTSRVLPYLDTPDAETGEERQVWPLAGGAVLSELREFEVVDRDNHRHRVTVSHQPLPLTGHRVELGYLTNPDATPATGNDSLYDPATRSLHPIPGGGLILLTAHTDRAGRLSALRWSLSPGHVSCEASLSADGGRHWRPRLRLACRGRAIDNLAATTVTSGSRLVVFSRADPAGHVRSGRGRFWISTTGVESGRARIVRESWAGQDYLELERVGPTVIVSADDYQDGQSSWRTVDPVTGQLGPAHRTARGRQGLVASTSGDVGWETGDHRVVVYDENLSRPRLVDPR